MANSRFKIQYLCFEKSLLEKQELTSLQCRGGRILPSSAALLGADIETNVCATRGARARLSSVLSHPTFCDERPAGTPSPDPLRLMKAPSRATLSPGRGPSFRHTTAGPTLRR